MSIIRHFISIIVTEHSEHWQRFHFNSSEVKQGSECSERFHFNRTEVKQLSVHSLRDFISIAVK